MSETILIKNNEKIGPSPSTPSQHPNRRSNQYSQHTRTLPRYDTDFARRKLQADMIAQIDKDITSQADKMKYMSRNLSEISEKVKNSRMVSLELQRASKENSELRQELGNLNDYLKSLENENAVLNRQNKAKDREIEELREKLRNERVVARDSSKELKDLGVKFRDYQESESKLNLSLRKEVIELTEELRKTEILNKELLLKAERVEHELELSQTRNLRLEAQNEKIAKMKENAMNESSGYFSELRRYKELYETERTRAKLQKDEIEENLRLLKITNQDYERCILKLQELELRCEDQVKINNRLRDELNFR